MSRPDAITYSRTAITLHWLIAAAVIVQLAIGLWMVDAADDPARQGGAFVAEQWHKSLGLTILTASLLRLVWRIWKPPPPLPSVLPLWQRRVARAVHALFYMLMIGLPLVGWAAASADPFGLPIYLYGLIEWPLLPVFSQLENPGPVEAVLQSVHRSGAYLFAGLILLHVAAALKHQFADRNGVLARMVPGLNPRADNGVQITSEK